MKVLQDHPMNIPTKLGCNWASGITERRRLNTDNKLLTPMGLFFLLGTSDQQQNTNVLSTYSFNFILFPSIPESQLNRHISISQ